MYAETEHPGSGWELVVNGPMFRASPEEVELFKRSSLPRIIVAVDNARNAILVKSLALIEGSDYRDSLMVFTASNIGSLASFLANTNFPIGEVRIASSTRPGRPQ